MMSFILGCYLRRCFSFQMPCASSLMLRSVAGLRWLSHSDALDVHSDGAILILDGLIFLFDLHLMSGDVILQPWDARACCGTFRWMISGLCLHVLQDVLGMVDVAAIACSVLIHRSLARDAQLDACSEKHVIVLHVSMDRDARRCSSA